MNKLGFLCTYEQGDPASPIYAIFERGSAEIHLNAYKPDGRAGLCSCHVLADPIDDLFAEYEAAGIGIVSCRTYGAQGLIGRLVLQT